MEGLTLCSGRAHKILVDRVGVTAEVDRDVLGICCFDHHTGAGCVFQQFDGLAVLGCRNCVRQARVVHVTDLSNRFADRERIVRLGRFIQVRYRRLAGDNVFIRRCGLEQAIIDDDVRLSIFLQRFLDVEFACEFAAVDRQRCLVVFGFGPPDVVLDVAVDHCGVFHCDLRAVRIVVRYANIECVCVFICFDLALDRDRTAVVGNNIAAVRALCAVKDHVFFYGQVAVVLHQHARIGRGQRAVLQGDIAALLEVHRLALRAGRAYECAVDRVGVTAEVDRDVLGICCFDHHAGAGRVFQKFDRLAVLCRRDCRGQARVVHVTYLSNHFTSYRVRIKRIAAGGRIQLVTSLILATQIIGRFDGEESSSDNDLALVRLA